MIAQDCGRNTILLQSWAAITWWSSCHQTLEVVLNGQDVVYPSEKENGFYIRNL